MTNAKCSAVTDPVGGQSMPLPNARQDTWGGYVLPCKYAGLLYEAKS